MNSSQFQKSGLAKVSAQGLVAMAWVVLASKFSSLVGQWILGYYLLPEDFGILAIITVAHLMTAGFREVGLNQQLMAVRDNFFSKARPLLISAHFINAAGMLLLLMCAPIFCYVYDDWRLLPILIGLTTIIPLNTTVIAYRAKLNIDFKFRTIAKIEALSVLVANVFLATAAYLGATVFSYLVSQVATTLALVLMYRAAAGAIPKGEAFTGVFFRKTFDEAKWLALSAYASSLSLRGDYFALGFVLTKVGLGIYYFGFQLVASTVQLLGTGMNQVLLPVFSAIRNDPQRVTLAFMKSLRLLAFASGGMCLGLLYWSPWLVDLLWSGKWNNAIIVAQLITISIPFRMAASPLGSSVLEALSLYKNRFILTFLDGVFVVIFALIGAYWDGYVGAAITLTIQRGTLGAVLYFYATKALGICLIQSLYLFVRFNFAYLLVVIIGISIGWIHIAGIPEKHDIVLMMEQFLVLISCFVALFFIITPSVFVDIKALILKKG